MLLKILVISAHYYACLENDDVCKKLLFWPFASAICPQESKFFCSESSGKKRFLLLLFNVMLVANSPHSERKKKSQVQVLLFSAWNFTKAHISEYILWIDLKIMHKKFVARWPARFFFCQLVIKDDCMISRNIQTLDSFCITTNVVTNFFVVLCMVIKGLKKIIR